jgi:hypothetical protein
MFSLRVRVKVRVSVRAKVRVWVNVRNRVGVGVFVDSSITGRATHGPCFPCYGFGFRVGLWVRVRTILELEYKN